MPKLARKFIKRTALAGTAMWLLASPGTAFAACSLTSGTGTVAAPGPNSTITCANSSFTQGLDVSSSDDGVTVILEPNAVVQANPGDAIVLTGNNSAINIEASAVMRDETIALSHGTQTGIVILAVRGSIENFQTTNTISVRGNNARFVVDGSTSGFVTTASSLFIEGDNALFQVADNGFVAANAGLVGPLIQGGSGAENFILDGRLIGLEQNGVIPILDAGDGNDRIVLTANTRLTEFNTLTPPPSSIRVAGGLGRDVLEFDGGRGDGTIAFSTTDIESLYVHSAARLTLGGSHAFDSIRVGNEATLQVDDFTSLGLANSTIQLDRANATEFGRLVINDAGTYAFDHVLSGSGEIQFLTGDYSFQTASPQFNGVVSNLGANLRIGNDQAFGQAVIDNSGTLTLTDVTLDNQISGNGFIVIDGNSSRLTNTSNAMQGFIDIVNGELVVDDLRTIGNGNTASLAAFALGLDTQLVVDLQQNGPIDLQATYQVMGNLLSGPGTLVKRGDGSLIVGGSASNAAFSGEVLLEGGWLHIAVQDGLGTGMNGTNRITFAGGALSLGDIVLNSQLSGTGTIDKQTAGRTEVTSDNQSATLAWDVRAGILAVADSFTLGGAGSSANIAAGSTLELTNTADRSLLAAISGTGTFRKLGTGRLAVGGGFAVQNLAVDAGTVAVANPAGQFQAGQIAIANGATFELTNASDYTLASTVAGAGTFRKLGAGRLSFGNPFSSGTLAVDGGSVRVNQNISANTLIASGARLDGTGRIIGNVTNNGTIAPGNSIGTLTIQGNYVHNAGAVLEIEFDGNGGIDLLDVTGNVNLNGGELRFVSLGGAEGSGGTFLRAGGTLTGTFATVTTVGAQLPLAVIYEANRAFMAPSVLTARPSTFNAQFLAAAESGFGFVDRVSGALARTGKGTRLWIEGFGNDGKRSASGQTLSYGHDIYGIGGGVTVPLGGGFRAALAAGWSQGDIALGQNGGGGEQDSVLGALALGYQQESLAISGGVLFGQVDQQTLRNVSFNGFSASVSGSTESKLFGGYLGLALGLAEFGDWQLGGELRGSWIRQKQDGYSESGTSPLRLTLDDLSIETMEAQAGLTLARQLGDHHGGAELWFGLGARILSASGDRLIPVSFAASNADIVLQGDTRDPLYGYADAGVSISLGGSAKAWLAYAGQAGANDRHEGRIGLSFGF